MSTTVQYTPKGVCSSNMKVTLSDNGTIEEIVITGGCDGNLSGISALVKGMDAQEATTRLAGIRCGAKSTSCPDQLTIALKKALDAQSH